MNDLPPPALIVSAPVPIKKLGTLEINGSLFVIDSNTKIYLDDVPVAFNDLPSGGEVKSLSLDDVNNRVIELYLITKKIQLTATPVYLTHEQGLEALKKKPKASLVVGKRLSDKDKEFQQRQADRNGDVFCIVPDNDVRYEDGVTIEIKVKP